MYAIYPNQGITVILKYDVLLYTFYLQNCDKTISIPYNKKLTICLRFNLFFFFFKQKNTFK